MTHQFARNSFFSQAKNPQNRYKSSLYYGVKRAGVMAKYSGFLATTCLVGLAVTQNKAIAAPTGGNVVGGNANITVSGANTNIIQSSNRAAIDWQSFSVAANESVNFTVPNGGATLNRVVGNQASLIQGTVTSNGSLYLVNPNGLVFDTGSNVSAQNFIATTSNIDPAKFMQGGKVTLGSSANNARISLKGTITAADRGIVGIFAPKVVNEGTITANLGSVVLAGVQSSVIDFTGDGLINFELGATTGRNGENLLASNKGVINASGGHVTLTAQGAESLFNAIVENTGSINATSLSAKGGTVTLKSNLGSVKDSGTIEASGITGGGDVLVWASEYADFTGDIKAEALANHTSSNGGAVEISGLKYLNFNGTVSTLSHNGGKTGSLLLDPTDIEIVATAPASGTPITVNNNSFTGVGTNNTSYILASNLTTALASNNVTVDATAAGAGTGTGKITVSTGIAWTSGKSLTLIAGAGGIAINAAINGLNSADATKNADLTLTSVGTISEGAAGTISVGTITATATKGDIILDNAGNSIINFGRIVNGSSTLLANNDHSITIVNNRTIRITGGFYLISNANHPLTGNINLTALAGDITQVAGSGISSFSSGVINLTATNGNITLDARANNYTRKLGRVSANAINIQSGYEATVTDSITASSGDIFLRATSLKINAAISAVNRNVTLHSDESDMTQSADGIITAGTLNITMRSGSHSDPAGNITYSHKFIYLDNSQNKIANLGNITYYNDANTALTTTTANINIANSVGFAVTGTITPTTGTLSLTAAGNITQTVALKVTTLKATATAGDVILTNVGNAITNLGASSGNNISVTNSTGLNIVGNVTVQNGGALNLVTVSGDITQTPLTQQVQDPAFPTDASKTITQNIANIITTPTLNVTAGGNKGIALGNVGNKIGKLGTLSFGSSKDLTIGNHDSLSIAQNLSTTGTINLISGGGIATTGTAKIAAGTLKGSAAGVVDIKSNITNLGAFTVTGNMDFTLTNDAALTISDNVSASGGIVNIIAGGGITTDTGKKITALTVMGSATDAVDIKTNVTNLGVFTVTGNKNFTLTNDVALVVSGNVAAAGGVVRLVATAGGISGSGKITALTVGGSAAGAVNLLSNVTNLGAFTVTGGGNFTLVNDAALTVNAAVTLSNTAPGVAGNISLTTNAGAIALNAAVTGGDVSLTASGTGGAISQSASLTVIGALTVNSVGAVNLTGVNNNAITKLAAINGSSIAIRNSVALSLTGNIATTGGAITIDNSRGSTDASKNITLGGHVTISGGNVTLDLGGGTSGTTHTAGGGTLATGNYVLKSFSGDKSFDLTILAGGFSFGTTANTVYIDAGTATLATTTGATTYTPNAQGVILVGAAYTDSKGTSYAVSATSSTSISTGAAIASGDRAKVNAGKLKTNSDDELIYTGDIYINGGTTDFTSITSTGGHVYFVGNAGYTNSNSMIVSAAKGITINSSLSVAANKLTLTTAGGGVGGAGVITAGVLTTTNDAAIASVTGSGVVGGINLTGVNQITSLGNLSNSGGGNISITNGAALGVAANSTWSNKSGMVIVSLTNVDLTLNGALNIDGATAGLRLDLGSRVTAGIADGGLITGGKTITTNGVDVYFSGKASGHSVTINLGATAAVGSTPAVAGGTFTHVIDKTPTQGNSQTIDKLYSLTGDASNFLSLGATSGITVVNNDGTTPAAQPALGKGLRFGSAVAVTIDGNWGAATATNNGSLRWIEGGTINVKSNTSFAGSIVLAATGSPTTRTVAGNAASAAVIKGGKTISPAKPANNAIYANLYVGGSVTAVAGNLALLQNGNITAAAPVTEAGATAPAPGSDAYGIYVAGSLGASGSVLIAQNGNVSTATGTVPGNATGVAVANRLSATNVISISQNGTVTANAGSARGINAASLVSSNGSVSVAQNGAITGTVLADGVVLAGASAGKAAYSVKTTKIVNRRSETTETKYGVVLGSVTINQSGVIEASAGSASGVTSGSISGTSGVAIAQNGNVTGSVNGSGINVTGDLTSSNGLVSVSNTVGSTTKATTGLAYGINLGGTVTAGNAIDTDATKVSGVGITITQNATVTGEANSAYGINANGVTLASGLPASSTSSIEISNKGAVAATQSLAKLSVVAYGVKVNGTVTGGSLTTNSVTISNSGSVTANHLADATLLADTVLAGRATTDAANTNQAKAIAAAKAFAATKPVSQRASAQATYLRDHPAQTATDAEILAAKKAILGGQTVAATGVAVGNVSAGGNLTIGNSVGVTANPNMTSLGTSQSATGVVVSGGGLTAGGAVTVSSTANITGANAATGVMLSPNVQSSYNRTTRRTSYFTSAVVTAAGNISITQTGTVSASAGTAYGVSADMMGSTAGKVSITQNGAVTGSSTVADAAGILVSGNVTAATGINLYSGYSTTDNATWTAASPVPEIRGNAAYGIAVRGGLASTSGEITVKQNGAVTGAASADGVVLAGASAGKAAYSVKTTKIVNRRSETTETKYGVVLGSVMINQSGVIEASAGSASGVTSGSISGTSGVAIAQNGNVTGSVNGSGINVTGDLTSSNGLVSVSNTVGSTTKATTGLAYGINLGGTVTAGNAIDTDATKVSGVGITITQNATVTGEANSAYGINANGVTLASGLPASSTSSIEISNKGAVAATQSLAKLSVVAYGVKVNGTVTGGSLTTNSVTISNSGSVTANHLADATLLADTVLAGRATTDAANTNQAKAIAAAKAFAATKPVSQRASAQATYLRDHPAQTATDAEILAAKKAILGGQTVAATGVAVGNVSAGGNLTIGNSVGVTANPNMTSLGTSQSATGVVVSGGGLTAGGAVTVSSTANITGANAATGVMLSPNVQSSYNRTTRRTSYFTSAVVTAAGNISITQTGTVSASAGTAYGVSADMMGSTAGKVSITQNGAVTGSSTVADAAGILVSGNVTAATGINLYSGYSTTDNATWTAASPVPEIRGNAAYGIAVRGGLASTSGEITVKQNGAVTGAASADGVVLAGASAGKAAYSVKTTKIVNRRSETTETKYGVVLGSVMINQSGVIEASAGSASGVTSGSISGTSGVAIAQNGNVTGSVNGSGINVTGDLTSSNGLVSVSNTVGSTTKATTGLAYGINLGGTVTAGNAIDTDATKVSGVGITITQNATVTGEANSAYGINANGVTLASGLPTGNNGAVSLSNNGAVTATQSLAKLSVVAYGVKVNGTVTGGSLTTNSVTISNSGSVTANHLADATLLADTVLAGRATTDAANTNQAKAIAAAKAFAATKPVSQRASAQATYLRDHPAQTATDAEILAAKKAILGGQTVAATGVAVGNVSAGGTLTIGNSVGVTANPNMTSLGTSQIATGVVISGTQNSGGAQNISNSGTVTGLSASLSGGLNIGGSLTARSGDLTLSSSNSQIIVTRSQNFAADDGAISVTGALNAGGVVVSFTAKGNIAANASAITAANVKATSKTGVITLNNTGNQIASFGAISGSEFDIGSSIDFTLNGPLTKTATTAGSLMKLSNYGTDKNITILPSSPPISTAARPLANNAAGVNAGGMTASGSGLSFVTKSGTGKVLLGGYNYYYKGNSKPQSGTAFVTYNGGKFAGTSSGGVTSLSTSTVNDNTITVSQN